MTIATYRAERLNAAREAARAALADYDTNRRTFTGTDWAATAGRSSVVLRDLLYALDKALPAGEDAAPAGAPQAPTGQRIDEIRAHVEEYGLGDASADAVSAELLAEIDQLRTLIADMHAAATGSTNGPLLGYIKDMRGVRDAFEAQRARADTLNRLAGEHRAEAERLRGLLREATAGAAVADEPYREWQRRAAALYEAENGEKPGRRTEDTARGSVRETFAWTRRDLPIFEETWTRYYVADYPAAPQQLGFDGGDAR
jgi:hypothetical protein